MLAKLCLILACLAVKVCSFNGPYIRQGLPFSKDIAEVNTFEELLAIAKTEEVRHDEEIEALLDNYRHGLIADKDDLNNRADTLKRRMTADNNSCQTNSEVDSVINKSVNELDALGERNLMQEWKDTPALKRIYQQFAQNIVDIQTSIDACLNERCPVNEYSSKLSQLQAAMQDPRRKFRPLVLRALSDNKKEASTISKRAKQEFRKLEAEWQTCIKKLENKPNTI